MRGITPHLSLSFFFCCICGNFTPFTLVAPEQFTRIVNKSSYYAQHDVQLPCECVCVFECVCGSHMVRINSFSIFYIFHWAASRHQAGQQSFFMRFPWTFRGRFMYLMNFPQLCCFLSSLFVVVIVVLASCAKFAFFLCDNRRQQQQQQQSWWRRRIVSIGKVLWRQHL